MFYKKFSTELRKAVFLVLGFILFTPFTVLGDNQTLKARLSKSFQDQLRNDSFGLYVADLNSGSEIFSINADKPLKPASVMKVLTSYVSLNNLGPEHRFDTEISAIGVKGASVDKLIIKGLGDPYMTSENIWLLAERILKLGIKNIDELVFDNTAFMQQQSRAGQRAYETAPSALTYNFNSLALEFCAFPGGEAAVVTPEAWGLPLKIIGNVRLSNKSQTAIQVEEKTSDFNPVFQVGGALNFDDECRTVHRSIENPSYFFANSLKYFLSIRGIKGAMRIKYEKTPSNATLLYTSESKPLSQIIADMNHFSTNFLAEQILYAIGHNQDGTGFDRNLGLKRLSDALQQLGLESDRFQIVDGSGLSHDNRLSVRAIARILVELAQEEDLRAEFESSLAVLGRSGTLKRRNPPGQSGIVRAKSGSLDGVSSLAGYVSTQAKRQVAFVIFQNNVASKDRAIQIEDRVLEAIYQD
jgi:serine-type D-Ala-D-Ala carboxypeptidase/endopeptidase (penicillin-binding protein 4)